ncbi:MAG: hypothetical protein ABFS46_15545 [Myxococcota bacterium]
MSPDPLRDRLDIADLLQRYIRTEAGWRIRERHFRSLHTEGELLPPSQLS